MAAIHLRFREQYACIQGGDPPFDPATVRLSYWFRGDYGGAPWVGTASAGTSGDVNHNMIQDTNGGAQPAPSVGTSLNGHAVASFNGTSQSLIGEVSLTGGGSPILANGGAFVWTMTACVRINSAHAHTAIVPFGKWQDDAIFITDNEGIMGLFVSDAGGGMANVYHVVGYDSYTGDSVYAATTVAMGQFVEIWAAVDGTNAYIDAGNGLVSVPLESHPGYPPNGPGIFPGHLGGYANRVTWLPGFAHIDLADFKTSPFYNEITRVQGISADNARLGLALT